MATSGTTTFESSFDIDDIIQEAYDRIGIHAVSGYQLKSARRSLNIMFQEWANRGLHYWQIDNLDIRGEYQWLLLVPFFFSPLVPQTNHSVVESGWHRHWLRLVSS